MEEQKSAKTIIGDDVEITGTINSTSDVQFAGTLNGDLNCSGHAVITKSATIKGNVSSNGATVEGKVTGNVTAKDRIELKTSARLTGDIKSKRLTVEDGVTFVGKAEVTPSGTADTSSSAPSQSAPTEDVADEKNKGAFSRK
ncbi:MAG: cytoskeletal protein CcmA (bactofilin family) [Candidatus Promineifilaceae bacterium]|jgi:cytoskeletal protein CcmA (bactofilin family)